MEKKIKQTNKIVQKKNKPVNFIFFIGFWSIAIILAFIFGSGEIAFGVFFAAIISGIIWTFTLNSSYSGEIIDIKINKYRDQDDFYREEKKAILKLDNGKTKKISPMPGWKIGDKIQKVKGESMPKKIN